MKYLAIFDVDGTLVKGQTQAMFLKFLAKEGFFPKTGLIPVFLFLVFYRLGFSFRREQVINYVFKKIRSLEIGQIEGIVKNLVDEIFEKYINKAVLNELIRHKNSGGQILLASAAVEPIIRPIAERLGVDFMATPILVKDGCFAGVESGAIIYGEEKAKKIKNFAADRNLSLNDAWMYSDHREDLSSLQSVGHPVVVGTAKILLKTAKLKNWKILN